MSDNRPTYDEITTAIEVLRWFRDLEDLSVRGVNKNEVINVKVWLEGERELNYD